MDLAQLRDDLTGELIEPGSPGYDGARRPAMARFADVRPQAVVRCASVEDVVRSLDFARRSDVPVVPRGGGHCFAGRSSTDGIALDLTPLESVAAAADDLATIGAGARLSGVYDALHEHGRTLPAGCGATVGIAGLTLGGTSRRAARAGGRAPAVETRGGLSYRDVKRSLAVIGSPAVRGPEPAGLVRSKSEFFRAPLPADAIAQLVASFDGATGPHRELNFTPMGGAYNRVPADATAFVHRAERFVLEHVGSDAEADWVRQSWALARRWGSGRVYPNFPDPELTDWAEAYHGGNHARLARAKRHYDADAVLHFPQSV